MWQVACQDEGMANESRPVVPVTIYDVARAAGVSASTVSRTFARPGRVGYQTAEHVRAVAAELGYRATELYVPLADGSRRHQMLALVVADISNAVFFDVIRGVEEEASRNEYTTILVHTRESSAVERRGIERILDSVDGLILSSSRLSDASIRTIAKQKPTIILNRGVTGVPCVVTDNARGMRRVLEHLGELGHRRLAYLAGPEASWANGMRWRAVREGMHELGMDVSMVQCAEPTLGGGAAVVERALAQGASAVLAYNDQLAAGFLRRAQEIGCDVPGDVSVVGFDNSMICELTRPGLTTVASPLRALGATAVRNLLQADGDPRRDRLRPVVLPTRLVVRGSTGAIAGN